ncbi:MAG: hypothetical protein ACOX5R_09440 [bacterium]|jgi:hypothetical protein
MKNTFAILLCLVFALGVQAQEEQRVDISNFEDEQDWSYQGGNISTSSIIPEPLETGVNAQEGSHALMVQYDNYIEGPWAWAQLNFPDGPRDLSGLTELHMWVYFSDDSAGPIEIQLTLSDASTGKDYNLGTQAATDYAQWSELVWQIDPVTSPKLTNITHFGGFIAPGSTDAFGTVYIDNVYAVRPAGVPELEGVVIYSFEEADPALNNQPAGWERPVNDSPDVLDARIGSGAVEPTHGEKYGVLTMSSQWRINTRAMNPLQVFDRWEEVRFIAIDVHPTSAVSGASWAQLGLVLQLGWEDATEDHSWHDMGLQAIENIDDGWGTRIWEVDMTPYTPAFQVGEPDGPASSWFLIALITQGDAVVEGQEIFIDNIRVFVPKQDTSVADWTLF